MKVRQSLQENFGLDFLNEEYTSVSFILLTHLDDSVTYQGRPVETETYERRDRNVFGDPVTDLNHSGPYEGPLG